MACVDDMAGVPLTCSSRFADIAARGSSPTGAEDLCAASRAITRRASGRNSQSAFLAANTAPYILNR